MLNDEIVDEVQNVRTAHAARFNFDLQAIYADLKLSEAARIAAGHPYIQTPYLQRNEQAGNFYRGLGEQSCSNINQ